MVASTLQQPRREWFDILDDWLNEIALSLWVGLDYFFPTAYLAIGDDYWHDVLPGWYTHGLASSYLEGANFLTAACVNAC